MIDRKRNAHLGTGFAHDHPLVRIRRMVRVLSFVTVAALAAFSRGEAQRPRAQLGLEAKVDAYVQAYLESGVFSGSMLVAHRGKVLLKKGYGMSDYEHGVANTPQTRYQIASISKLFTAIAIGVLEQKGLLSRNDRLQRFIPDFPAGAKITIDQLIRHRSGIVGDLTDFKTPQSLSTIISQLKHAPLGYEPNARSEYSNHG
jgi:CubicO group peptidase (beta-lactamase class C family)